MAVEIKDLSVYYDNTCALSDINLEISERDFMGIIGPNGGGKSTLLKAILGLVKPTRGSITVFGQPPDKIKTPLGYVPQFSKFDKQFPVSVEQAVLMGCLPRSFKLFHRFSVSDMEKCVELMKRLDIYDLKNRQIGQLSGGQLQRVLIARALASEPKILLLDEPTASVDTNSKAQIYNILRKLNSEMAIVVVTHDTGAVSSYIKNIACLNRSLYYHGEPSLSDAVVQQTYGCPVDLIAHGVPHRVFHKHEEDING